MTVEGMLYRMRVGCPWRDLPKAFGFWNSIYKRFNAWSAGGKWLRVFKDYESMVAMACGFLWLPM
jgi:transposase